MLELDQIREILIEGQKLSGQGSYERRAPNKKAKPYLVEALKQLRKFALDNPNSADGWHLLSLAEET